MFLPFHFYERDVSVNWFVETTNTIRENQTSLHIYPTQHAFRTVSLAFNSRANVPGRRVAIPIWNRSPEAEQSRDNGRNIAVSFAFSEARKTAPSLQKDFNKTEYSFFFSLHSR